MKSLRSFFSASAVLALVWFASPFSTTAQQQPPSPAVMFHVANVRIGTTATTYDVTISWQDGLDMPYILKAESYNVYRAWGFGDRDEDFVLVGSVHSPNAPNSNMWTFVDQDVKKGVHTYYVRGVASSVEGDRSPSNYAVCPSSYCIGPDQQFKFTSTPETFALPGKTYTYNAASEHPSIRVWGFIRYAMVEGPEGMTIDERSGKLTWDIPEDASGLYPIKITSYMQEYKADTSILFQEWTLRIAEEFEIKQIVSAVKEEAVQNSNVFPNPADNRLQISFVSEAAQAKISIASLFGTTLFSETVNLYSGENSLDFSTSNLAPGSYVAKISFGTKQSTIPFVIAR